MLGPLWDYLFCVSNIITLNFVQYRVSVFYEFSQMIRIASDSTSYINIYLQISQTYRFRFLQFYRLVQEATLHDISKVVLVPSDFNQRKLLDHIYKRKHRGK